jgi:phospholipid/cholesterol/gamma-HCH transport system ATP-binding protein
MSIAAKQGFIEIKDLRIAFKGNPIHRGIDLIVPEGQTLVVIGGSGEGKSVLLKQMLGLLRPDSGSVKVDGQEITGLPEREMAESRRKVGILFQNGALFDSMNVFQNVAFPMVQAGVRDRERIESRVTRCLEVVELAAEGGKMPVELSGGMRKRVALARAIVNEPRCVLYDEPTAGLDPIVADSINILIRRLQKNDRVTSVVVTHDMQSAFRIADRIAYLRSGRIYFDGTPEELQASEDPKIRNFIEGVSSEREKSEPGLRPGGHNSA